MPNWKVIIRTLFEQENVLPNRRGYAFRWASVSELRMMCHDYNKREVQALHQRRGTTAPTLLPKPSVPCIQGILEEMILRAEVVPHRGANGAAYFSSRRRYLALEVSSDHVIMPRDWNRRRECQAFNRRVNECVRANTPVPSPWGGEAPRSNGPAPVTQLPEDVIMPEEAINIIHQLLQAQNGTGWTREINNFIASVPGSIARMFQGVDHELQPYVDYDLLVRGIGQLIPDLVERARERKAAEQPNLEEEYYSRLLAKGEALDAD